MRSCLQSPALGIDRTRVIAGGGSSGATIAAFAAYNTTFEPEQAQAADGPLGGFITSWKVTAGGPPAILFFGTEDPFQEKARDFARQLIGAGTRAEFYTAEGQRHGSFNRSDSSPWHAAVLRQIDLFLASLGYLNGDPTVAIPNDAAVTLQKRRL